MELNYFFSENDKMYLRNIELKIFEKQMKRVVRKQLCNYLIVIIILLILYYFKYDFSLLSFIIVCIIEFLILVKLYIYLHIKITKLQIKKDVFDKVNRYSYGKETIILDDIGIKLITSTQEIFFKWSIIKSVEEISKYILVYIKPWAYITIPFRDIKDTTKEEFISYINTHLNEDKEL